jgi:hypothetical protein
MILLDEYRPMHELKSLLVEIPCLAIHSAALRRISGASRLVQISNVPLSVMITMTLRNRSEELRDNVFQPNPILKQMTDQIYSNAFNDEKEG